MVYLGKGMEVMINKHGGNIYQYDRQMVDFSANLNPPGMPDAVKQAVIDSLPHGSFFHATGGAVHMAFQDRVKILPYEIAIGCVLVATSTAIYGLFAW